MKKFGIGRKDKSSDSDDPNRGRLFGGKSKSRDSPTPASSNPYAIQQQPGPSGSDPYAQSARGSFQGSVSGYGSTGNSLYSESYAPSIASTQPPPYQSGEASNTQRRQDKPPVPYGGYGGGSRYGADQGGYGAQRGYGGDRYGAGEAALVAPAGGGYGGLGRSRSQETLTTQAGREALFGGARERYEQKQSQTLPPEDDPAQQSSAGQGSNGGGGGGIMDMGYGAYQDRQLTAEEEEEEDVQATKQQIRALKQQDVSSTRNALRIAEEAERTGRETLERLAGQGERIHNTEKNLDLAANQNRLAEAKARELKHLNRSMFAVQVSNPFTKSRRERNMEESIMDQHHSDRLERDATRAAMYQSQSRQDEARKKLRDNPALDPNQKRNLAQRSKYQFEADSEDEAMEDEIDNNLDLLAGAAGRLNLLGRAMGQEVDEQNKHIDRIVSKADKVDDGIAMNRARLDRIR